MCACVFVCVFVVRHSKTWSRVSHEHTPHPAIDVFLLLSYTAHRTTVNTIFFLRLFFSAQNVPVEGIFFLGQLHTRVIYCTPVEGVFWNVRAAPARAAIYITRVRTCRHPNILRPTSFFFFGGGGVRRGLSVFTGVFFWPGVDIPQIQTGIEPIYRYENY